MELVIIARFHTREGNENKVAAALREQVIKTRLKPGCLSINAYRSVREPRLFFIFSRWSDETAFDVHAELLNTQRFVETMGQLIDHPFETNRTVAIA